VVRRTRELPSALPAPSQPLHPPFTASPAAGWAKVNAEVPAHMSRLALRRHCKPRAHQCSQLGQASTSKVSSVSRGRRTAMRRAAAEVRVLTRSDWPGTTQNLHIDILIYSLY